jgi:hypothetical protein
LKDTLRELARFERLKVMKNLCSDILIVRSYLTSAKIALGAAERELERIEAEIQLTVEGSNDVKRKAAFTLACRENIFHRAQSAEARAGRDAIARLTNDVDNLTRQFTAVGFQARLHASLLAYLAAAAPGQPVDVSFDMGSHTNNNHTGNGTVTPADAAAIGL